MLVNMVKSIETTRERSSYIKSLGESENLSKIVELIDFAKSEDYTNKRLAASALGKLAKFKPEIFEAVPILIRLLDDEHPQIRQYAIKSLGKIGSERAIPQLESCLNDEKEYNRESAMLALKNIGKIDSIKSQKNEIDKKVEEITSNDKESLTQKITQKFEKWREEEAIKEGVPIYRVFRDRSFEKIMAEMPKSIEELRKIKGLNKIKLNKYGENILKILNSFRPERETSEDLKNQIFQETNSLIRESKKSSEAEIFTVIELTKYIKNILESDNKLSNLTVRGEISGLRQYASGHTYFALKDETSKINIVLFRREKSKLKFDLKDGMKIILRGDIDVYEPYGEYKIIASDIQPDGLGALHLAYLQLKDKLTKEGLFEERYKKQIPQFPKTVGVVTSESGAVLHDIINVITKRYPLASIVLAPALVQGEKSARSIVNSLNLLNESSHAEVIILGRGGGSFEDLNSFNDESVARAIFQSKIPIVSAVGHETDVTIADFVADLRAPTPSAAAERIVPDISELYDRIKHLRIMVSSTLQNKLESFQEDLKQIKSRPIFKKPLEIVRPNYIELDKISEELKNYFKNIVGEKQKAVEIIESKILALNPTSILKRGYSIVMKKNKILTNSSSVSKGEDIKIVLHGGEIDANVKKTRRS
jgi:exodeoxyribonuclease VII large subunit